MKILALETSTEACSVALSIGGEVYEKFEIAPSQHSSLLLPMIEALLAETEVSLGQLDGLAFASGPGSFTGLRIAAGVIQGIALGADLPVVPVSTLQALALCAIKEHQEVDIMAALDARKNEVYWGLYRYNNGGLVELQGKESVCLPDEVSLPDSDGWFGIGPGWTHYSDALLLRAGGKLSGWKNEVLPRASYVAQLAVKEFTSGRQVSCESAVPVYIRDDVAKKKQVK